MKASIVDLRYRMTDVLKALARNEVVTILYHGEEKGTIMPSSKSSKAIKTRDTELFGMYKDDKKDVDEIMHELRKGRYDDL